MVFEFVNLVNDADSANHFHPANTEKGLAEQTSLLWARCALHQKPRGKTPYQTYSAPPIAAANIHPTYLFPVFSAGYKGPLKDLEATSCRFGFLMQAHPEKSGWGNPCRLWGCDPHLLKLPCGHFSIGNRRGPRPSSETGFGPSKPAQPY